MPGNVYSGTLVPDSHSLKTKKKKFFFKARMSVRCLRLSVNSLYNLDQLGMVDNHSAASALGAK